MSRRVNAKPFLHGRSDGYYSTPGVGAVESKNAEQSEWCPTPSCSASDLLGRLTDRARSPVWFADQCVLRKRRPGIVGRAQGIFRPFPWRGSAPRNGATATVHHAMTRESPRARCTWRQSHSSAAMPKEKSERVRSRGKRVRAFHHLRASRSTPQTDSPGWNPAWQPFWRTGLRAGARRA